jgi:hypothetical protein
MPSSKQFPIWRIAHAALKGSIKELCGVIEEQVGPIGQWPLVHANCFFDPHLGNLERLNLTLFLVTCAANPDHVVQWYSNRDMLRDSAAVIAVKDILAKFRRGGFESRTTRVPYSLAAEPSLPEAWRKNKWDKYTPSDTHLPEYKKEMQEAERPCIAPMLYGHSDGYASAFHVLDCLAMKKKSEERMFGSAPTPLKPKRVNPYECKTVAKKAAGKWPGWHGH